jgi:hypothetical protein
MPLILMRITVRFRDTYVKMSVSTGPFLMINANVATAHMMTVTAKIIVGKITRIVPVRITVVH